MSILPNTFNKPSSSFQYETRTFPINSFQLNILETIKSLPPKHLHYIVGQQSITNRNMYLKEMKKHIRAGIRRYIKQLELLYTPGLENRLVKYFCVFETVKEFSVSQHHNTIPDQAINMGIHFHLFITSPDKYPWVSFGSLSYCILNELTHFRHNRRCIYKYDYHRIKTLDENFILYHTKQFQDYPSSEMIMTNLTK